MYIFHTPEHIWKSSSEIKQLNGLHKKSNSSLQELLSFVQSNCFRDQTINRLRKYGNLGTSAYKHIVDNPNYG